MSPMLMLPPPRRGGFAAPFVFTSPPLLTAPYDAVGGRVADATALADNDDDDDARGTLQLSVVL